MTRTLLALTTALLLAAAPAAALDEEVTKYKVTLEDVTFQSGETLSKVDLGVEWYGSLNASADNVVLIAHFLAGDSHAAGRYKGATTEGWWNDLIGPGKPIDTNKYLVICTDLPAGMMVKDPTVVTVGPRTINPDTGEVYGLDFPEITVADQVLCQKLILDRLGIKGLEAVVGPSLGAMIAWQWAVQYPDFVKRVIPVAAPTRFTSTERMGFNSSINIIKSDPAWFFGNYHKTIWEPDFGVAMALQGLSLANSGNAFLLPYLLPSLLSSARDYDANTYIRNLELHANWNLGAEYGSLDKAIARVKATITLIGFADDDFVTTRDLEESAAPFKAAGKDCTVVRLKGSNGHLSVLYDLDELETPLRDALSKP